MCSWCWGFAPSLDAVERALSEDNALSHVTLRYVMGGLAKDSDEPMPPQLRDYVRNAWKAVKAETGATFNWAFWDTCVPRRSTYPACRAVLAAAKQAPQAGPAMFRAIQRAYYQEALNPSDVDVLIATSARISPRLDTERFAADLVSRHIDDTLHEDFGLRSRLGVREFPSLILSRKDRAARIVSGWATPGATLARLEAAIPELNRSDPA
jgi:putative protein-disulfide isomerase